MFDGRLVSLSRPLVMGIVNLTPDSFFDESRASDADSALWKVSAMIEQGADIIDLGACSTRPGSASVGEEEELRRLDLSLAKIRAAFPDILLSVDTFRVSIARRCAENYGVQIINDISGGKEEGMFELIGERNLGYVLMHSRGTPETMQSMTDYGDVTAEVMSDLAFRLDRLRSLGASNVMVDPGFGFAKTVDQNYELLRNLDQFHALDAPLLVGISRKSMIGAVLGRSASDCLAATLALNAAAVMKGASILRVHDVKETVDAVKVLERL